MPTTGSTAWPWWLLGLVLVGVAITVPLVALRRRRSAWSARLDAATVEITWFAGQLIPQLQLQGSHEQFAGAWHVTQDRVSTLEDTLTGLESTAPQEQGAVRAHDLRDAVRAARARIDAAAHLPASTSPPDITTTRNELSGAKATLEEALAGTEPGHQHGTGGDKP